jgi:hypothetical protein
MKARNKPDAATLWARDDAARRADHSDFRLEAWDIRNGLQDESVEVRSLIRGYRVGRAAGGRIALEAEIKALQAENANLQAALDFWQGNRPADPLPPRMDFVRAMLERGLSFQLTDAGELHIVEEQAP